VSVPLQYICGACGQTCCTNNSPEEEASRLEEAKRLWNKHPDDPDMVRICDDCFNEIMNPRPQDVN
jgi:hypothetical protein